MTKEILTPNQGNKIDSGTRTKGIRMCGEIIGHIINVFPPDSAPIKEITATCEKGFFFTLITNPDHWRFGFIKNSRLAG